MSGYNVYSAPESQVFTLQDFFSTYPHVSKYLHPTSRLSFGLTFMGDLSVFGSPTGSWWPGPTLASLRIELTFVRRFATGTGNSSGGK